VVDDGSGEKLHRGQPQGDQEPVQPLRDEQRVFDVVDAVGQHQLVSRKDFSTLGTYATLKKVQLRVSLVGSGLTLRLAAVGPLR
jgi:hypothetical protein